MFFVIVATFGILLLGVLFYRRHLRTPVDSIQSFVRLDDLPLDLSSTFPTPQSVLDYVDDCTRTGTVPQLVWTFWFSSHLSPNRQASLLRMPSTLQIPVLLLTPQNMQPFLRWPVHPAVAHLSGNHKSDYFRIYFLLHYGGGYTDIKRMIEPWNTFFDAFNDPNVWFVGAPEIENGMAVPPGSTFPSDYYKRMISNGFLIARPRNPCLVRVHHVQHHKLDRIYPVLKAANQPPKDRCCDQPTPEYPLRWAEMMGEIMTEVAGEYTSHFSRRMRRPPLTNYL